ncbi:MAG: EAL domain-containing protein [Sulfuricurvum sp.]|nr:EAL domain-containing protein [Sulfuricurvum sp.]
MKLLNHKYRTPAELEIFIDTIIDSRFILVQLFSGVMDKNSIQSVLDIVTSRLPDAALIGATTAGEIMDGSMSSSEIILSFSLFDSTDIRTYYFPKSDYDHGVIAAKEIINDRTKVCIAFSEGLKSDSESFLDGFTSQRSDVVIAGGNAGDDLTFTRTYIFHGNTIYDDGIVIAVLDSDELMVHNSYSLHWTSIGKEMTVTKADKNVIYEIDGHPVHDLYIRYLGEESIEQIPASAISFPFIKIEDGVRIARSLIAQLDDGGFVYAGHFHVGDKIRFAIGNVEEILNRAIETRENIAAFPAEATYVYSCSVRKLFLQDQLNYELGLINEIAPTAGFFTYGEFFHSPSENLLLNVTTTTLSLSESKKIIVSDNQKSPHIYRHTMLKSLTQLVNVTQNELDDNIKILDQYKMVLDESSIVSKTDVSGRITYVNDAFCDISGYSREELIGKNHNIIRHPDNEDEIFKNLWSTINSGGIWKKTFKNLSKNGKEYYVKTVIVPIFNDKGMIVEFIAARVDVSELILKEQIIQRQLTDELTGLKNRTALVSDLEKCTDQVTLVVLNIDRFSTINDYFGYEIGDDFLKEFATYLDNEIGEHELYRISGDEFVFICSKQELDEHFRERLMEYIIDLENRKFQIADYDITVNISSGVAYSNKLNVYNLAHMALKEAKELREKLVIFNDHKMLAEKTHNNIVFVDKIKLAIEEDRIVPFFQGIVDNKTRKIEKYEALIRLIDTDGTVLTPYSFLEHAKKAKLYEKLTLIMIKKVFEVFENLEYEVSINLTLQDILSEKTRTFLFEKIAESSIRHRLVFEIVESEGIENFEEVTAFIQTLKEFGCKVAIDDFGTGYSNFNYLSKLDIDYIKIDGSLIKNINDDPNLLLSVESILFFAQKKGIKTIAEFVEDEAIYEKLVELGIDYSQGYLFSIPSPTL